MGIFGGPSTPPFTEKETPDQSSKVFLITGATSGVGLELASILYAKNARVYIAARSTDKATSALAAIKAKAPASTGSLHFLRVDFADLTTIKPAAHEFLAKESTLHVLFNNAGVMIPPQGSTTAQGYEMQLGTNNVGPFLFTKLLQPALVAAARTAPPASVRIVWVSSSAVRRFAPTGGVELANLDYASERSAWQKYGTSKAGNIFHATEYARRFGDTGVLSIALDPGNLATDLYRQLPGWQYMFVKFIALKPAIYGAYTELFAGLSPVITAENNGGWVEPFGVLGTVRKDVGEACKQADGPAARFWDWTEAQIKSYE